MNALQTDSFQQVPAPPGMVIKCFNLDEARLLHATLKAAVSPINTFVGLPNSQLGIKC